MTFQTEIFQGMFSTTTIIRPCKYIVIFTIFVNIPLTTYFNIKTINTRQQSRGIKKYLPKIGLVKTRPTNPYLLLMKLTYSREISTKIH